MKTFKVKYQAKNVWGDVIKAGTYRINSENKDLANYRVSVAIKKQYPKVQHVKITETKEHVGLLTRFVLWLHE